MLQLVCKDIDENNTTYTLGVLTYRMLFFFFFFSFYVVYVWPLEAGSPEQTEHADIDVN